MNVMAWADRHLERFGDFDGVVFEERVWKTAQVHDASCRFAKALLDSGIPAGERTVLWMPNSPELVVAFTGVIRAGGVAVIASDASPPAELERIVAHCS